MQAVWVRSLVRELRSYLLHGQRKNKNQNIKMFKLFLAGDLKKQTNPKTEKHPCNRPDLITVCQTLLQTEYQTEYHFSSRCRQYTGRYLTKYRFT